MILSNSSRIMILLIALLGCSCHSVNAAEKNVGPFWIANIKASYPQVLSAELGGTLLIIDHHSNVLHGPFLSYEPGILGQKAHVGYGVASIKGGVETIITGRLSASYFNVWGSSLGLQQGDNYYGVELVGSYNLFLLSVGAYRNNENHKNIVALGVGFGF